MPSVKFQGNKVTLSGNLPIEGQKMPRFTLCGSDFEPLNSESFEGKNIILNIFPSIDTPVCALSVRRFNERASKLDDVEILCISADLPFAANRFCLDKSITHVKTASFFRSNSFTEDFGVKIQDGLLSGLSTRAILVSNKKGFVIHSELVSEITSEPNYDAALEVLL
ncbi:thiol peroxidase [Vibrio atlanticus]|nr:thiol peroxidase [Vibrio atlanticus]